MAKQKKSKRRKPNEDLLLNEVQLLLAEKRTYLSMLRTGLAVLGVPMTVIAVLAATFEYHHLFDNFWLGFTVMGGLVTVAIIGMFIFFRAEARINKINHLIKRIEKENKRIAEIVI